MKELLFSFQGRINRKKIWFAFLIHLLAAAAVGIIMTLLWQVVPGSVSEDGNFHVEGAASIPYLIVGFGYLVLPSGRVSPLPSSACMTVTAPAGLT